MSGSGRSVRDAVRSEFANPAVKVDSRPHLQGMLAVAQLHQQTNAHRRSSEPTGTGYKCEDSRVSRRCGARLELTVRKRASDQHTQGETMYNGEARTH
eukprot:7226826-Pyramimonas_sp.AAC.1